MVYLACPPGPRKEYALAAAALGKALFLEKPLGVDIAASADLVARIAASGVPAAVNFTQAAGAALTDISAEARSGAMGDLAGVDIVVTYGAWPRAWQQAADWLRLRDEGKAILLVSVELDEILSLSDRIAVMFDGQIMGERDPATTDERELGLLMPGVAQ